MKKDKLVLFVLFFAFPSLTLLAKKIEVKGRVVAFNMVPVVKANVKILGSERFVTTDQDGYFTCICQEKTKLFITAEGFNELTIRLRKKNAKKLVAKMKLERNSEASKIAISKGHILQVEQFKRLRRKRSGIKDYSSYTSVLNLIENEFPSLQIVNGIVIIRGRSSIKCSNAAKFELDGVMVDQISIENLPTCDIASMKVVKGSDATMYGIRGATGVILIRTKQNNPN